MCADLEVALHDSAARILQQFDEAVHVCIAVLHGKQWVARAGGSEWLQHIREQ